MNPKVTAYIDRQNEWKEELKSLRHILNQLPLQEEIKWGMPVYVYKDKNVLGISGFKSYFGLWFYQGALLKDDKNLLINAQENKTKAMRQMRFSHIDEIDAVVIKTYVLETIENINQGKEIKAKRNTAPLIVPPELASVFSNHNYLKAKFDEFSLSKKREFCEHILTAKRASTKRNRVQKIIPLIAKGIGLNDKYKK